MQFKRPPNLKHGDKVAIISPSAGLPSIFPWVYEQGLSRIQEIFHLEPIEYPTARQSPEYLSKNPKARAEDINKSFHVTANMVLSLAKRARQIFESSEVEEKRQLLNFVFQNLELKDKKLLIHYREPFKMIKDTSRMEKCPGMCR